MTRCFNCGSDNPDGLKFCNQCGASLNVRCSQCGFNNAPGARFCGECGASLTGAPVRPALGQPFQAVDRMESRSHSRPSERRHLTVLFCDLVGSTEIAARLDPEEWQETVAAYHRSAAEAITRFGGHVAKYLGDGVMAYFGYPEAHDNDAERAARAGLAILEAIAKLNQTPPLPDMRTSSRPLRAVRQTRFPSAASGLRLTGSAGAPSSEPSPMPNSGGGNTRQRLSARVGIDSGAVVVGVGAGTETDVFGEAPNIAARVQTAAAPDTVLISAATYRLVAGLFVVEDCGAQALKGLEQPLQLYRVIRPAGVRGRLAAAAASRGLTPFVGREDELRMLASRWQRVLDGEGQVVLIIGEAGIGKSRMLQQFHQQIAEIPHTWVEAAAAPFYQNTPFYPVIEVLWQLVWEQSLNRFADYLRELQSKGEEYGANAQSAPPPSPSPVSSNGGGDRDAPHHAAGSPPPLSDIGALGAAERSRAKESATCVQSDGGGADAQLTELQSGLLSAGLNPAEVIPLIAPLLHLPLSAKYAPSSLAPEQQRRRLLATLIEWLLGAARAQPLVIVIEDLHWADPSTLELIQLMAEQGATARLLLLYTARPEFRAEWPLRAHHTQITLNRLSAHNVREIIAQVAARNALASETLEAVVKRTSGVPLFVEELTRAVLESGNTRLIGREIPVTLHDSLMARLDRLGSAKEVLQIGSVIGGEFSYELLHAIHSLSDEDLQRELRRLIDADLLYVRGLPPNATYQFKHALIRDAAYEVLLKSRRKELHRQVAHTIEEKFPALKEAHPELLARHWTEADEIEHAIAEWEKAGKAAEARNAFHEARESYQQALALLNLLPESPARDSQELQFRKSLFSMLYVTHGWAVPDTVAAANRVEMLAEKSGNFRELIGSITTRCHHAYIAGELHAAGALADHALKLAEGEGNPTALAYVHQFQISIGYHRGDLARVEKHLAAGLRLFDDPVFRADPSGRFINVFSLAARSAWAAGRADVARERIAMAVAAINPARPYDRAFADIHVSGLHTLLRENEEAEVVAARALELCEEHKIATVAAFSRCLLGHARAQLGRPADGIELIRQGIGGVLDTGSRILMSACTTWLAVAQQRAGALDDALETVEEALQISPEVVVDRPETLKVRGELRLAKWQANLAEADFRDSIALAKGMGAKAWELRTTMSLARLLDTQGRRDEARTMLAEIYSWFTEGFDTPDLKDAKALLDRLTR